MPAWKVACRSGTATLTTVLERVEAAEPSATTPAAVKMWRRLWPGCDGGAAAGATGSERSTSEAECVTFPPYRLKTDERPDQFREGRGCDSAPDGARQGERDGPGA